MSVRTIALESERLCAIPQVKTCDISQKSFRFLPRTRETLCNIASNTCDILQRPHLPFAHSGDFVQYRKFNLRYSTKFPNPLYPLWKLCAIPQVLLAEFYKVPPPSNPVPAGICAISQVQFAILYKVPQPPFTHSGNFVQSR